MNITAPFQAEQMVAAGIVGAGFAVESFRLCSTDEFVCSSGVVPVCACRTILGCGFGVWCPLAAHKSSSLVRPPWLWHWANELTGLFQ